MSRKTCAFFLFFLGVEQTEQRCTTKRQQWDLAGIRSFARPPDGPSLGSWRNSWHPRSHWISLELTRTKLAWTSNSVTTIAVHTSFQTLNSSWTIHIWPNCSAPRTRIPWTMIWHPYSMDRRQVSSRSCKGPVYSRFSAGKHLLCEFSALRNRSA